MRRAIFAVWLAAAGWRLAADVRENVSCRSDPTQTYTLYLPASYDASKQYPVLLVFDPRGRATKAANIFVPAAEEYGWIVISSNQTRSDGSSEPNERAIRALLPELGRYPIDANRIYAAGFSGTAMMAWGVGIATGRLAGVIGVGGRFVPEVGPSKFNFAHYGFAGVRDFNQREMRMIDAALDGRVPHRYQSFDGEHQWLTPALAREAIGWFETLAGHHVAEVLAEDLKAADALQGLAALRRYREIARTYEHVNVAGKIAVLEKATERDLAEEKKWDEFEADYVNGVLARLPSLLGAPDLTKAFRIPDLKRRAARSGAEAAAARRLLELVYAQTSFYLMQQFFARYEYGHAAAVLRVATDIHPERWDAWYNLAAAHARGGQPKPALAALEKSIAAGFHDAKQLAADDDFVSLRNDPKFQKLLILASPSQ